MAGGGTVGAVSPAPPQPWITSIMGYRIQDSGNRGQPCLDGRGRTGFFQRTVIVAGGFEVQQPGAAIPRIGQADDGRLLHISLTLSLRLPQHLLDSIKAAANARDVPYQSLMKVWLQEKLQKS